MCSQAHPRHRSAPPVLPPAPRPADATGPALILVGALMILNVTKIPWQNVQEAVPAFLTMVRRQLGGRACSCCSMAQQHLCRPCRRMHACASGMQPATQTWLIACGCAAGRTPCRPHTSHPRPRPCLLLPHPPLPQIVMPFTYSGEHGMPCPWVGVPGFQAPRPACLPGARRA